MTNSELIVNLIILILAVISYIYVYKSQYKVKRDEIRKTFDEFEEKKKNNQDFNLQEVKDLDILYRAKEEYIFKLLKEKFDETEMSYIRYKEVLDESRKKFYEYLNIADTYILINKETISLYDEPIMEAKFLLTKIEDLMLELIKYRKHDDSCDIEEELTFLKNNIKRY